MTTTYDLTKPTQPTIIKDPDATLDYSQDWSAWLTDVGGDTITDHEILFGDDSTCTLVQSSVLDGVVTAFISGGTLNTKEQVTYRITTAAGRIDDRSIWLNIKQR